MGLLQVPYIFRFFFFFSSKWCHDVLFPLTFRTTYHIGKSTVSRLLQEQSIPIIDADKIARKVVEPGQSANRLIRKHFGDEVFLPNGEINRPKLGEVIFSDPAKRKILNQCTHPAVRIEMLRQAFFHWLKGADVVVLDVPLLLESGMDKLVGTTVVVYW